MISVALEDIADIVQGGRHGLSGLQFVPRGYPAYGAGGLNGYLESYEFHEDAATVLRRLVETRGIARLPGWDVGG